RRRQRRKTGPRLPPPQAPQETTGSEADRTHFPPAGSRRLHVENHFQDPQDLGRGRGNADRTRKRKPRIGFPLCSPVPSVVKGLPCEPSCSSWLKLSPAPSAPLWLKGFPNLESKRMLTGSQIRRKF